MLFIHPMWDSESERIGKQRCTPIGYTLHGIADLTGVVGLILLLATFGYWAWRSLAGTFHASLIWFLAVPLGLGLVSELTFRMSWWLAYRRGFQYDVDRREASWMESGQRRSYMYQSER